jgi:Core-2/I-Branching enzyme
VTRVNPGERATPAPTGAAGPSAPGAPRAELACVVLAHEAPDQVRRLVKALEPLPVFLHVDARVPESLYTELTRDLPDHVSVTERVPTAWATFGAVRAELLAYEQVLAQSSATHVAWMSGSDYPLLSVDDISQVLTPLLGRSIADFRPLPIPYWGMSGGLGRLRYYHWAWRRHVVRLPIPRRIPAGLVPAGGPVQKILARHHAEALLRAVHDRPELIRFWRRAWAPDETFVATIMSSPSLVPDWADHHVDELAWVIDWRQKGIKGPPWLTLEHLDFLRAAHRMSDAAVPMLFARKFHPQISSELLDAVDDLRTQPLATD